MPFSRDDEDNANLRDAADREARSMHEIAVPASWDRVARQEQLRRFLREDAELLDLLSR